MDLADCAETVWQFVCLTISILDYLFIPKNTFSVNSVKINQCINLPNLPDHNPGFVIMGGYGSISPLHSD